MQVKENDVKITRLPEGSVTPAEWDAMTTPQRLEAYKRAIRASSYAAVAKSLGVATRTVERWREGVRSPCERHRLNMELIVVHTANYPLKEFLAVNTVAIDPALDVFDRAFVGNNVVALNAACYVFALKVATAAKANVPRVLVPNVTTCVGVMPAYATVSFSVPGEKVVIEVKITHTMHGSREYIARVDIVDRGKTAQRFAYSMSDRAIAMIIFRINKYLEHYGRKKHKRAVN